MLTRGSGLPAAKVDVAGPGKWWTHTVAARALAAGVLALCLHATVAYAAPNDVYGWQKVKWGVTPEKLEAAYGGRLKRETTKQDRTVYTIDPYEIFGRDFVVHFYWKDGRKLDRVFVAFSTDKRLGPELGLFENILDSMTVKYGTPTKTRDDKDKQFRTLEYKWSFRSTVIRLFFQHFSGSEIANPNYSWRGVKGVVSVD